MTTRSCLARLTTAVVVVALTAACTSGDGTDRDPTTSDPAVATSGAPPEAPTTEPSVAPAGPLTRTTIEAAGDLRGGAVEASGELSRRSIEILDDLEAQATDAGALVTLPDTVLFDFDEDVLRPQAAEVLDDLVTVLEDSDPAAVTIAGHTDGIGDDDYNQQLSERRAAAVEAYFLDAGIDPDRLSAAGFGETQPIAQETDADGQDDPDARARNRRVEITIEGISPDGEPG